MWNSTSWCWSETLRRRAPRGPRGEGVGALAADLEIDSGIGLDEPLVGGWAVETDFAVRPDFRRCDHSVEDISELVVEVLDDRGGKRAIERESPHQQQRGDPECRDDDHSPCQGADGRRLRRYGRFPLG